MKFLVDPGTRTYKALSLVIDLFVLNLLFLLTSIPLLTISTGLMALHEVSRLRMAGEGNLITNYLHAFRTNLRQGLCVELIFLSIWGVMLLAILNLQQLPPFIGMLVLGGLLILLIYTATVFVYIHYYLSRYRSSVFRGLIVTYQVAALNLKQTLGLLLIAAYFICAWSFSGILFTTTVLLSFTVGFAGLVYYTTTILSPVFAKYGNA